MLVNTFVYQVFFLFFEPYVQHLLIVWQTNFAELYGGYEVFSIGSVNSISGISYLIGSVAKVMRFFSCL